MTVLCIVLLVLLLPKEGGTDERHIRSIGRPRNLAAQ